MADLVHNLALGFGVAFSPVNLMLCLIGALVGTLVGVLPGIGTIATVAMLLPITFGLPPVGALIMLAGIYYGAQYGGSTTSILVNIPGEATSVVTTLDGHQMAKQGRAGPALAIAAIGSFFAGCVATVLIAVLGAPLTKLALAIGPAEYFSLMCLGLIFAVVLAKGSVLKAIAMIVFGLLLSMVGSDIETGASRMAFNIPELADGLGFATVAMGVFGFAEIMRAPTHCRTRVASRPTPPPSSISRRAPTEPRRSPRARTSTAAVAGCALRSAMRCSRAPTYGSSASATVIGISTPAWRSTTTASTRCGSAPRTNCSRPSACCRASARGSSTRSAATACCTARSWSSRSHRPGASRSA